ncbi:MFS transporter [Bifidobacterium callitrichidarum]|uniref:MFS transporter n=1 Tax=Bifidobacterium callitrichidarum TaxID=2052941 RepID=A0A2U2N7D5_9BIFI|nr:MFS transporter [Bifidobacterium callitrichidarum]PWG65007.1 MFS transporter [Bifidobacterium callitrichidarum]
MSYAPKSRASNGVDSWIRHIALLLTGQAFSLLGSNIVQYALWWWIVLQEKSGWSMLLATLFGVMPQGVVSIFGGSMADRYNRKTLIMLPDLIIAAVTVLLSVSFSMGWANLAILFIVLFIRSAGGGIQMPAIQSFIPDIVPTGKLLRVNSIYGVINSVNLIAAPAIAAVLINIVPLWSILLIDVATAIIGVGFVACIRPPRKARKDRKTSPSAPLANTASNNDETRQGKDPITLLVASARRSFADLQAGFAYAMSRPMLKGVILGDALTCFMSVAPMNLTLLLMTREYSDIDLNLGFINLTTASDKLAANELGWSIGMLLGGALMSSLGAKVLHGSRAQIRVAAYSVAVVGLSIVGLGLAPNLLTYLLIDLVSGVSFATCVGPMRTIMQSESDEAMVGRIFGLDTTITTFAMPLGMLIFAPLADIIPISWVFVAGGLLTLPGAWYMLSVTQNSASHERENITAVGGDAHDSADGTRHRS